MDIFCVILSAWQRLLVNFPAKRGSRSLMIFLGSPKRLKTCVRYSPATSSAEIVLLQGMKTTAFEQSWSVMVSMVSYPFDSGNLTMKSIATVSKGNACNVGEMGCKVARVWWVLTLLRWHSPHPCTYSQISSRIPGHQYLFERISVVQDIPGCP